MLLNRAQVMTAIRIRKLLEQAAAEGAAGPAYKAKALALAGSCDNGPHILYDGKKLGDGHGHDRHDHLSRH